MAVDLDNLEALEKAATPGGEFWIENANYIAALRNAAPALLAEVRQLRERNQRLRESLAEMLNQYGEEGNELGWEKRLHDEARAALAGTSMGGNE